jgi:conjugative transposon TraN protein
MKRLCEVWFVLISFQCFCQSTIPSYPLEITLLKTTNIVFPYAIKSVDRGSKDFFVQKAKGIENVLEVKAAKQNFPSTNLSVITADGKLYSFLVNYSAEPATLNFSFVKDPSVSFLDEPVNKALLQNDTSNILSKKHFLDRSVCDQQMILTLHGIYINKQVLWFCFRLHNYSLIDFKPGYIKFFIGDNHKIKRAAQQETELIPLVQNAVGVVHGKEEKETIFAFPQFTLPKDKRMVCQISEQNGGRLLALHIKHKTLLKARAPLP